MKAALAAGVATAMVLTTAAAPAEASVNGGADCAACTLLMGLAGQQMQLQGTNAKTALNNMCGYLPSKILGDACVALIDGDSSMATAMALLNEKESADTICNTLSYCKNEDGNVCHLFPLQAPSMESHERHIKTLRARFPSAEAPRKLFGNGKFDICTIVPGVCEMKDHRPFSDLDDDYFSTDPTLRGYDWRGKDCDDLDKKIFPGRDSSDALADENCNGIYGIDASTLTTYEDAWCKGTGSMGVASLGDSATAHFRLPPQWFTASQLNAEVLKPALHVLENEIDWPMLSWSTGWANASDFAPLIEGPMDSLYSLMRQDNLCNHRDYQNIGVNGARVSSLVDFANDLDRNRTGGIDTKPLMLIMSMVGNDVCSGHHTYATMTTPAEYRQSVTQALQDADSFLPTGSVVVLVPLVDGRILYDTMHARIHPIGTTNQDVTYAQFYDYLNCLDVSPCWGWMNSNETVRNYTSARAAELGEQLPLIVNATKGTFKHITPVYAGNLFNLALTSYPGPKTDLIEPVDGFHPSQLANSLIGRVLYSQLKDAGVMPPVNPNNAKIAAQFGNQGGYN